jgi:hypothetical protein
MFSLEPVFNLKLAPVLPLLLLVYLFPANAAEPQNPQKYPVIRPPDESFPSTIEGMHNISTFLCRVRSERMQPDVTLEINFEKQTVNEISALMSPIEIRWVRTGSRGRVSYYRLNRKTGFLQINNAHAVNQSTGWCERIENR